MDAHRFDALARTLTEDRSRRGALAAVVGGALGLGGLVETDAKKKKKKCPPCKKRKKGKCKGTLPDGTPCAGGTCRGGSCVAAPPPGCPSGQKPCNGECIPDSQCCTTDDCPAGQTCQDGGCVAVCTPNCAGKTCGDDGCSGSCGPACTGGMTCQNGACACPANTTDCSGVCTVTGFDPANCGTCGTVCNTFPNVSCFNGHCCRPSGIPCSVAGSGPDPQCCSGFCISPGPGAFFCA